MHEASIVEVDECRAYAILDAWQDEDSATRKATLRKHERRVFKAKVEVILLSIGAGVIVPGYCRDISVAGVGFGSRRPFKINELLALRLPLRLVLCQVRYSHYVSHGMHGVGAMFHTVLKADTTAPVPIEWVLKAGGHV